MSVCDKRDKYKFNVVRFSPKLSNIPERIGYNTFISQVLRFSKICNDFDSLKIRVINLYNMCINLGYDETKLKYSYQKLIRRHKLCKKFPELKIILD